MRTSALWLFPAVSILIASSPLQAVPTHQWSKSFGDASTQNGRSTAVDPSGNVLVTGDGGGLDFGGGPLPAGFFSLVKFDSDGNHLWSKSFGGDSFGGEQRCLSVAADGSGNVVITGYFFGTIDFGGGLLASGGGNDVFLAKFDPSGNHLWSKQFGEPLLYAQGSSIAVDGLGNIVVAGFFAGTIDLGGGALTSLGGPDIFVARFDTGGNHQWSRRFGNSSEQYAWALALDASGNVAFTGQSSGTVDFGGGPITGDYDIYLVKLDSNGNHLWSRYFPGNDLDHGFGVAADGSANIILTGDFYGTVNLGGGPLTSPGNNNYDIFLAKFDPNGVHVWSKRFGNTGSFDDSGNSVAACASGNIVVTGSCVGPVDFGGGPLTGNGFIARFDASGAHLSSLIFGTSGNASGSSVAAGDCEDFVVTGSFGIVPGGTVDFGGGPLTSAGNNDIFIAKFKEQPLPVLITSFEAMSREGSVEITWDIWSDEAIESYRLYRRDDARLHALVIAQGPLDATTRSYVDASVEPGTTYHYELLVHTQDGDDIRSPVATVTVPALKATLGQNFPNPFKPATVIEFTLGEQSSAVLGIYDVAGRLVARLDQGVRDAGTYRAGWDGRDAGGRAVSSGVYFYRLEGAPGVPSKKMVLIK